MRLWHKDLISVLPDQWLKGEWRECCAIARNIAVNGTPNHRLVNKVLMYPISHLWTYGMSVQSEMLRRGLTARTEVFKKWIPESDIKTVDYIELFSRWHNDRYFWQCYYNLQEKYDCEMMSEDEWHKIYTYARYVKARDWMKIRY